VNNLGRSLSVECGRDPGHVSAWCQSHSSRVRSTKEFTFLHVNTKAGATPRQERYDDEHEGGDGSGLCGGACT
jgi:hypothetical protein